MKSDSKRLVLLRTPVAAARDDELNARLDRWAVPPMRPDLRRRLVSIPAAAASRWRRLRFLFRAGGLAAVTAMGAMAGLSPVGLFLDQSLGLVLQPEDQLIAVLDTVMNEVLP